MNFQTAEKVKLYITISRSLLHLFLKIFIKTSVFAFVLMNVFEFVSLYSDMILQIGDQCLLVFEPRSV